ncbi:hypothetical protein F9K85_24265, partial [Brucella tritici]|uniref:hypothetical protein n=1 Tax=Brucella tritici TaxID=94626 RepID=UPI00124F75B8
KDRACSRSDPMARSSATTDWGRSQRPKARKVERSCGAALSSGWLIRERSRVAAENKELRSKFADLNLVAQRNEALLNLKDQR